MKQIILVILDGFGYSSFTKGNAIFSARKPNFNILDRRWPTANLQASGIAVGLPWREEGNSEVGHVTIGTGRVVWQYFPRINFSISDGSFFSNSAFLAAVQHVKRRGSTAHIIGLVSTGTVHSALGHCRSLIDLFEQEGVGHIRLHVITDAKDAPPNEAGYLLKFLQKDLSERSPHTKIASIIGRNFALDRDSHWDRTQRAYRLFTEGEGEKISDPVSYIESQYEKGFHDDEIEPAVVVDSNGDYEGVIQDGDAVVFFDFREDSERQIVRAFALDDFNKFSRKKKDLLIVTMTAYEDGLPVLVAFNRISIKDPLARVVSDLGCRQLHVAETGKYAHVTYFLNGLHEKAFPGEEWLLIPSEREAGLDRFPVMKAKDIKRAIIKRLDSFDFIAANFANADQVGHTGNFNSTVKAIEVLDAVMGDLMKEVDKRGSLMVITADHGNAEEKFDFSTGGIRTEHTSNPVPFYLFGKGWELKKARSEKELSRLRLDVAGVLTDVAPTILELVGVVKPAEMTGRSLLPYLRSQIV